MKREEIFKNVVKITEDAIKSLVPQLVEAEVKSKIWGDIVTMIDKIDEELNIDKTGWGFSPLQSRLNNILHEIKKRKRNCF